MPKKRLEKKLGLFDVFAISTGAMFSSGFFLLPGIAAAETGPSVYLAYLASGLLIIPAMLSVAELSTAMPKAGGAYYFLDRSLGPLVGTVGGLGSWIGLMFKSAFALLGMGAYLALYIDMDFTVLALILTVVFGLLNIFGAKETTIFQRILVTTLVTIMAVFVIQGLSEITGTNLFNRPAGYESYFRGDLHGFVSTIGLVFVSFMGLTKVASVAEEVRNPDRNIPLGMALSLVTACLIYGLGVYIMVQVLDPNEFYASLTPVADAGAKFLSWLPGTGGVIAMVVAAVAAFASTGNAGIMSASRYPFAMSRDKLVSQRFGKLGKTGTPVFSITVTVLCMLLILLIFDVEAVAKLASAFQLLLFGILCLAVIVMRESGIAGYSPGFSSPLYPWTQIGGMLISVWLVAEMGLLAVSLTGVLVVFCVAWYYYYAGEKVLRQG
ncbi:MAG: APC family permease, partial [Balneolaceae bacterium]|nr:APC family permease [Balneolaceae bacterium]